MFTQVPKKVKKVLFWFLISVVTLTSTLLTRNELLIARFGFSNPTVITAVALICGLLLGFLVWSVPRETKSVTKRSSLIIIIVMFSCVFFIFPSGVIILVGKKIDDMTVETTSASFTEPICNSTKNVKAIPSAGPFGKIWVNGRTSIKSDLGREVASSIDQIDTLFCVTEWTSTVQTCSYQKGSTVKRLTRHLRIQVVDWTTHQVRGDAVFNGSSPDDCPTVFYIRPGDYRGNTPDKIYGGWPEIDEIKLWLVEVENGDVN